MKSFDELGFNRSSSNCVRDNNSSDIKDRFLRMSERGKNNRKKIERHFYKKSAGLDFSGHLNGRSFNMSNMSSVDSQTHKTMSPSLMLDKPIIEEDADVNPFEEKYDIEKEAIEDFIKFFKGKLPINIIENIDSEKDFNKLKNDYKETQNAYEENFKAKCIHKELKEKMKKLMTDLERAKTERDSINNQLYETKKSFNQKRERINTESMVDDNFKATLEYIETTSNSKPSLEEQIEQMELQISKLKGENKAFYEDYDTLCDIYKNNSIQNTKLKAEIKNIDNNTMKALATLNNLNNKLKHT